MRQKILQALAHSRAIMRNQIELHDCFHNGNYAANTMECGQCEFEFECHWLCNNDEFVALEQKSMDALIDSLEFAQCYVDALVTRRGHDRRLCRCEVCAWLRKVRRLLREAQDL